MPTPQQVSPVRTQAVKKDLWTLPGKAPKPNCKAPRCFGSFSYCADTAKSKNHITHNQSCKWYRNGIKKPRPGLSPVQSNSQVQPAVPSSRADAGLQPYITISRSLCFSPLLGLPYTGVSSSFPPTVFPAPFKPWHSLLLAVGKPTTELTSGPVHLIQAGLPWNHSGKNFRNSRCLSIVERARSTGSGSHSLPRTSFREIRAPFAARISFLWVGEACSSLFQLEEPGSVSFIQRAFNRPPSKLRCSHSMLPGKVCSCQEDAEDYEKGQLGIRECPTTGITEATEKERSSASVPLSLGSIQGSTPQGIAVLCEHPQSSGQLRERCNNYLMMQTRFSLATVLCLESLEKADDQYKSFDESNDHTAANEPHAEPSFTPFPALSLRFHSFIPAMLICLDGHKNAKGQRLNQ
ncbi:mCG49502 [Mus musculus]|nr:mCG49502 [Mus musculus]